jgi:hypothetical protein
MAFITFVENMMGNDETIVMYSSIISVEYRSYVSKVGIHLTNNSVVWISSYESGREMTKKEKEKEKENVKKSISDAYASLKSFLMSPNENVEVELEPFVSVVTCKEEE